MWSVRCNHTTSQSTASTQRVWFILYLSSSMARICLGNAMCKSIVIILVVGATNLSTGIKYRAMYIGLEQFRAIWMNIHLQLSNERKENRVRSICIPERLLLLLFQPLKGCQCFGIPFPRPIECENKSDFSAFKPNYTTVILFLPTPFNSLQRPWCCSIDKNVGEKDINISIFTYRHLFLYFAI